MMFLVKLQILIVNFLLAFSILDNLDDEKRNERMKGMKNCSILTVGAKTFVVLELFCNF